LEELFPLPPNKKVSILAKRNNKKIKSANPAIRKRNIQTENSNIRSHAVINEAIIRKIQNFSNLENLFLVESLFFDFSASLLLMFDEDKLVFS
jgi:hypothetical protein